MCTVTVHRTGESLLVTMNRDEARARGPEIPPARHLSPQGTAWIAPADSDKGSTWVAMNAYGLVACLLNRYQDAQAMPPDAPRSRGEIIPAVMEARSVTEAQEVLASGALALAAYPAFTLVLADVEAGVRLDWRGTGELASTEVGVPWHLVTSSFFEPARVLPWREQAFEDWLAEGARFDGGIPLFHLSQPVGKETIAPMMARDISCTRSITQACVDWSKGCGVLRHAPVDGSVPDWEQFAREHVLALNEQVPR